MRERERECVCKSERVRENALSRERDGKRKKGNAKRGRDRVCVEKRERECV